MSALPQPRPRRKGFTPFPNEAMYELPRLASGDAQFLSLMLIASETVGAIPDESGKKPDWSRPISTAELAEFCRCSLRAVQMAIDDLTSRKVLEAKGPNTKRRYWIPFETWSSLPDRPKKVVTLQEVQDAEEDTAPEETVARETVIPVFEKPVRFKRGARTRPTELPAAPGKLRILTDQDIECSAQIAKGMLDIHVYVVPTDSQEKVRRTETKQTSFQPRKSMAPRVAFEKFEAIALKCDMSCAPGDLAKARKFWAGAKSCADGKMMTPEDQQAAVRWLSDAFVSGEYPSRFVPLPQNFLEQKLWFRPLRRKPVLQTSQPQAENSGCELCVDGWITWKDRQRLKKPIPCSCPAGKKVS